MVSRRPEKMLRLLSRSRLVSLHSESDLDLQNDTVSIKKSGKSIPKSPKFPAGVEFLPPLVPKSGKTRGGKNSRGGKNTRIWVDGNVPASGYKTMNLNQVCKRSCKLGSEMEPD